jgi:hypothetical protein
MDLRDRFAARFAAALASGATDPERDAARIAHSAYDLAEAMMLERDRRIDGDEQAAILAERELDDEAFDDGGLDDRGFDEPGVDDRSSDERSSDDEAADADAVETRAAPPPALFAYDEDLLADEPLWVPSHGLLDEPEPMLESDELPGWLEPADDLRWEREDRATTPAAAWSAADPMPASSPSRPPGPGLARTEPLPAKSDAADAPGAPPRERLG